MTPFVAAAVLEVANKILFLVATEVDCWSSAMTAFTVAQLCWN
jgi:hypothetical protein